MDGYAQDDGAYAQDVDGTDQSFFRMPAYEFLTDRTLHTGGRGAEALGGTPAAYQPTAAMPPMRGAAAESSYYRYPPMQQYYPSQMSAATPTTAAPPMAGAGIGRQHSSTVRIPSVPVAPSYPGVAALNGATGVPLAMHPSAARSYAYGMDHGRMAGGGRVAQALALNPMAAESLRHRGGAVATAATDALRQAAASSRRRKRHAAARGYTQLTDEVKDQLDEWKIPGVESATATTRTTETTTPSASKRRAAIAAAMALESEKALRHAKESRRRRRVVDATTTTTKKVSPEAYGRFEEAVVVDRRRVDDAIRRRDDERRRRRDLERQIEREKAKLSPTPSDLHSLREHSSAVGKAVSYAIDDVRSTAKRKDSGTVRAYGYRRGSDRPANHYRESEDRQREHRREDARVGDDGKFYSGGGRKVDSRGYEARPTVRGTESGRGGYGGGRRDDSDRRSFVAGAEAEVTSSGVVKGRVKYSTRASMEDRLVRRVGFGLGKRGGGGRRGGGGGRGGRGRGGGGGGGGRGGGRGGGGRGRGGRGRGGRGRADARGDARGDARSDARSGRGDVRARASDSRRGLDAAVAGFSYGPRGGGQQQQRQRRGPRRKPISLSPSPISSVTMSPPPHAHESDSFESEDSFAGSSEPRRGRSRTPRMPRSSRPKSRSKSPPRMKEGSSKKKSAKSRASPKKKSSASAKQKMPYYVPKTVKAEEYCDSHSEEERVEELRRRPKRKRKGDRRAPKKSKAKKKSPVKAAKVEVVESVKMEGLRKKRLYYRRKASGT